MKMIVFGTSQPAINEGMSYFGISPGPKSLADFMFYHQYAKVFEEPINSLQINITLDNGVDSSIDSDATW